MSRKHNRRRDAADPHRYRTEIPNFIDELGLSVAAFRLYVRARRVCGADGKVCFQSTRTLSRGCKMAAGSVCKAKRELLSHGLIGIARGRGDQSDHITMVDVWKRNLAYFADRLSLSERSRSNGERSRSPNERSRSPDETKKELREEGTKEENTTPIVPLEGDLEFWIVYCFRCLKAKRRRLPKYALKELKAQLPDLVEEKPHADRLVQYYDLYRDRPYSGCKLSVESLVCYLLSQFDVLRSKRFI